MSKQTESGMKIAVVGGGVAGIVSAYLLQQKHQVTLFEQNDYLGGHTNTIVLQDGPDAGLAVDTGFIVLNDATYPLFQKFLAQLGVATRVAEMSFGFRCLQTGLVYAGNDLNGLFAAWPLLQAHDRQLPAADGRPPLLPEQRSAWAAWNFTRESSSSDAKPAHVSYYMNLLQGFSAQRHYCVTLNRQQTFRPETVIAEFDYHHPQYSFASLATQVELPTLNGQRNSCFCGSDFGYGFHEDAVRSAVATAKNFGIEL